MKFGDCFLMASVPEAKEMCSDKMEEMKKEIAKLKGQQKELASESEDLKKKLYAKFGNQIQLEEN
jgi:chaperonin cofactor prefoldin